MAFLDEWVSTSVSGGGNFLKDGKGVLVIKDVTVQKTFKDKRTFIMEAYVKSSSPSGDLDESGKIIPPNAVTSTVSYVQLLTKFESAKGNAKAACLAILGPETAAKDDEGMGADFTELMGLDKDGYSQKGVPSIMRGAEISYETHRKATKDGSKILTIPRFTYVDVSPEQIAANRKLLGDAVPEAA